MPPDQRLAAILAASPNLMRVLSTARDLGLPDWMVMSGAVYQTAWNALTGRDPDYGINDYDLAYFDPDLSPAAEEAVRHRVAAALPAGLAAKVEVCNQARVHIWYPEEFGRPYAPLRDTPEALERCLSTVHAVGVRLRADGTPEVLAPFGVGDVFAMTVRPAPGCPSLAMHRAKAASARARWPEVTVVAGDLS